MTDYRFMRLKEILTIIPISRTAWWSGVKSGRFPQPIRLTERTVAWRSDEIEEVVLRLGSRAS
jgi:prophage regulatory protein